MLKNITITDDCRLFSLDIKSLYPKVPLWKALQCTRQALQADETLSKRTDWSVDDIMKLLEICLETHFKTLDGYIYTQMDGTPIGKSISGPLAGIYLNWFEKTYVFNEENRFKSLSGKELEMIFLSFGIKEILNWTVCFGTSMGLNLEFSSLLRKKRMGVYRFSIFISEENLAD